MNALDVGIMKPNSILLRQLEVIDQSLRVVDGCLEAFGSGVQ